jgi:hypothetical protein
MTAEETRRARGRVSLAGLVAIAAVAALAAVAPASEGSPAHTARTVSVKDEARLHLVKSSGSLLIDEGTASGSFPGRSLVRFTYNGSPSVGAQITIYGHFGNIQARGAGQLSSPTSPSPSFRGTLTITGGSGRYAHASGSGRLYGVFYRRSYAIVVQTEGALRY